MFTFLNYCSKIFFLDKALEYCNNITTVLFSEITIRQQVNENKFKENESGGRKMRQHIY